MSWKKLLADKRVTQLRSSKAEMDNLRSIATRSMKDMIVPGCRQTRDSLWRTMLPVRFH